jgi:glutamate-1-semialdehyde 2,1-aminomutase
MRTDSRSAELARRAARAIPGGVNSNFRLSSAGQYWASGAGSRLSDVDGNDYVDYVLGMGAAILGHSPPRVLERAAAASAALQCPAGQQLIEIELAEQIQRLVPSADLVRTGCTGSEMVQLALRLARAATGRELVVKFEGHYHGWLDSVFAGTAIMPPPGDPSAIPQSAGQSPLALADLVVLPWNDIGVLERFLASRAGEVAAVIMEPVLCNTSVIVPRDGFLAGVRSLCDEHGIVLVFDEVITGFRLDPGGAQARLGVRPDLTVLGKALGAGFPIAALAGREAIMRLAGDGTVMHGGTYNATTMCVAAALGALEELTDPERDCYGRMERNGELLAGGLRQASQDHGGSLAVQGVGPVLNTTFAAPAPIVDQASYRQSDLATQQLFVELLGDEGVRVTSRGTWFVSAAHSEDDIALTMAAVERVLARIDAGGAEKGAAMTGVTGR